MTGNIPRILLVDNDEESRHSTAGGLRSAGFSVTESAAGEDALLKIALRPDLVLLDSEIPDIEEHRLKQLLDADSIPVLRLTADSSKTPGEIRGVGEADGKARSVFMDPSKLISKIRLMLRIRHVQHEKKNIRLWNAAFDAFKDAVCIFDADGRILRHNAAFSDFARCGDRTIVGLGYKDIMQENGNADTICPIANIPRSKARENNELELGGRFFQISTDPVFDEDGSIIGFVDIIKDVTDLKAAEHSLENNYSMLSLAGEIARFGGWSVDLSTNIVTWSDEVAAIHEMPKGYSPSVNEGISFYHPSWRPRITEVFTRCALEGEPYDEEMEILTSAGRRVWVRTVGTAVRDGEGNIVKVQGAFQDISRRKETEVRLKGALRRLEGVTKSIIRIVVKTIELKDPYTAGHQERVGDLAGAIASEMGLSEYDSEGIRIAGTIHDLGKIAVSSDILSKSRELSAIEFALVKEHAQYGYNILKNVVFEWPVAQMAHQHHERLDGSGYPQGLRGDAICHGARIIAVADVVEAMASHRPYRPPRGLEQALEEVRSKKGSCTIRRSWTHAFDSLRKNSTALRVRTKSFRAREEAIEPGHPGHAPRKKSRGTISFMKQAKIVLAVVASLMAPVRFADVFLLDIGKDRSHSTLVKMIIERREPVPLFE
jgi:PAS domain S-box-containing protein